MMRERHGSVTCRKVSLQEVVNELREQKYIHEVNMLRRIYPLSLSYREADGSLHGAGNFTSKIPRVCFASQMVNRGGQCLRTAYNGLVLLEVNNLTGYDEAASIRQSAAAMPQTLLAFVGASGRSVKIVCRGELSGQRPAGGEKSGQRPVVLPTDDEEVGRFHLNLYEKARLAYNAQLGVTIEKLEPVLHRICYMSIDSDLYYNSEALPFYADLSEVHKALMPVRSSNIEPDETAPGLDRYLTLHHAYHFALQRAYDDTVGMDSDDADYIPLLLTALADYCVQSGIPQGVAVMMTVFRLQFRDQKELVRLTFDNAYRKLSEQRYRRQRSENNLSRNVPPETLLTMRIEMFLRDHYELRRNVMRGVAEYRLRRGIGFDFADLTEQVRHSITLHALKLGIRCWDKDIRRFVESNDIELYDPIEEFLERLPRWDGIDRVTPLAQRVPTSYSEWPHLFHVWLRSMVAMWQGKGQLTGNALVPLLIGRQGCGKSSFCAILLPRELRDYYNDRINFKNEADLNLGLTSFALINLDEFDKITGRQQVVLKYLLSTAELKYRPPYGKAYSAHRRYASFIATTNDYMPLTDPSGSRRFVCVEVEGAIDFKTRIDHAQLFAQLCQEVSNGERYWLTNEEEQALMAYNRRYQRLNGVGEMVLALYCRPEGTMKGQWLSLKAISARLKATFGSGYQERPGTLERIGQYLNRAEYRFESRRMSGGMEYWVADR